MTRLAQSASAALAAIVFSTGLFAQAHRSIILGQVTDNSGAAVPDAEVRVIQMSTSVARTTRTNQEGHFEVPGLFPGRYRVEASHPGFKTAAVSDIEVTSGRTIEVDLRVEVGEVRESVTITAEKEILDTANADVNTVVGARAVADLPLGQGHATYLFLMAPGADSASSAGRGGNGMDIQPLQRQGTSQTRFDGSPQGTTEYTLDGTPNTQRGNSLPGGAAAFNPSTEVVQEVRVQTSTFDASIGHTGGATVDLVLKAGTNEYHGNAVAFLRDPSWNANAWSANRAGLARQDFTYRRWGFSAGGPVWLGPLYKGKDRTFFYYGYEKWSSLSPNPATFITIPRPEQLNGDFSALLKIGPQYQLYDPDTATPAANGRIQRSPYPNNIIPSSRISPIAKSLSRLWPAPTTTGTADGQLNFGYNNAPLPRTYWASTLRVDHSLTPNNKLFGRLIVSETGIPFDTLFGRTDIPGLNLSGKNRDAALSDVWTFSPSFIGDFRASEMRFHWLSTPIGLGLPYRNFGLEGFTNLLDTTRTGLPNVVIARFSGFSNSAGLRDISEIRNLAAHFTKVHRNHGFKFGVDARWYIENRGSEDLVRIDFPGAYSNGPLDNSPAPPIGAGLADFLLGRFSSVSVNQPSKAANLSTYQGLYFHDDWKVNRRLTLNLGIRWEREGPPTERFNRALAGFAFDAENPVAAQAQVNYARAPIPEIDAGAFRVRGGVLFAGTGGNSRKAYQTDTNNFAPRIGMAFQAATNTVLRAGYGIFYVPYGQRFFANEGGVPGFDVSTTGLSSPDSGLTFTRSLSNPFPGGLNKPTGTSAGLATFLGQNLNLRAFGDNPNAYTQRWEASVQRRLGSGYKFEARYVGSRTLKMPISRSLNALPNRYLSTLPERDTAVINNLTGLVTNPFAGIPGISGAIGGSRTIAKDQLLRPYPEFGAINYFNHQGWTSYNALQTEFQRSFHNGLMLQTSYTFAKTLDALDFLNEGGPAPEKVISASDRPHIWRLIALYELPFGKGKRFGGSLRSAPAYLIRGWQIQGVTFIESGMPLAWGNVLFRGNIKDIPIEHQTPERMFNVDAGFERNSARQLANNLRTFPSRLSSVRSSSETVTDFSVLKNTTIKERWALQFRGEAYNVFNQHFFVNANTNPANTAFGTTTSASSPRAVQLGLKLVF